MRQICMVLIALVLSEAHASATDLPNVWGFEVQVYADVTDPMHITFDDDGNLFVGRDNIGSGGHNQDAVRIHRVGPGGTTVTEYGDTAIPDPDNVLFDADGTISGTPGAILVSGKAYGASTGHLWAILPDESVIDLYSTGTGNPNDMLFDSTGRLLIADWGLHSITVGSDSGTTTLYSFPSTLRPQSIAVTPSDRIVVGMENGTITVNDSDGTLIDDSFATNPARSIIDFGNGGSFGYDLYAVSGGMLLRYDALGNSRIIGTGFDLTFSTIAFGPDGALYVSELGNDRILRIDPALTGDLNFDGFVGLVDLDIILNHWNENAGIGNPQAGDLTGDGYVGLDDLDILLNNWNTGTAPSTSNVPEPISLTLLGLGGLAVLRRPAA